MRNYLSARILNMILGAVALCGTANASIISRNFLDEALTNYATTTALDLKANQRDFSALNAQISYGVELLKDLFTSGAGCYGCMSHINPDKFSNDISGVFTLLYSFLDELALSFIYGWSDVSGNHYEGFRGLNEGLNVAKDGRTALRDGWSTTTDTYKGVIGLNEVIGTLPDGLTVQGMYEGWAQGDRYRHGLGTISDYVSIVEDAYGVRFPFVFTQGSQSTKIDGVDYTGPVYPLWKLSEGIDKIGRWPTSIELAPGLSSLIYGETSHTYKLPSTIFETIADLYLSPLEGISRKILNLTSKIGELPTEYATVGAALSAIKGIAEEAKAAALAAIPDPKTEGASGKYVLTVDIVGDNATYTWEKIDRSTATVE